MSETKWTPLGCDWNKVGPELYEELLYVVKYHEWCSQETIGRCNKCLRPVACDDSGRCEGCKKRKQARAVLAKARGEGE
jgi:hypothetical protein